MGRVKNLRELIGAIKDKASQSKAALNCKPTGVANSFHLALLRATTHDHTTPPSARQIAAVLSLGDASRAIASVAIEAVMDRLQTTRDSSVALKCLLVVHHIIKSGNFILQDQLSVFPAFGGRNYLKLSGFRDSSTPQTWDLSSWVRWYAEFIEAILCNSRSLGFFLGSRSSTAEKDKQEEMVCASSNSDLLRETDSLVGLIEEIGKSPNSIHLNGNKLVDEIKRLVCEDFVSTINEISIRVNEFPERLSSLSFGQSVELVYILRRLEDCKERLAVISAKEQSLNDDFWGLIGETKKTVGEGRGFTEEAKLATPMGRPRSASDRFTQRVGESVGFGSFRIVGPLSEDLIMLE